MIVDCHCHAGQGDGLTGPWDTIAPLADYVRRARAAGIERTVLFSAFHSDNARANRRVAEIVRSDPERFLGFVFLDAQRDRGRVAKLVAEAVEHSGFCGIKVHMHQARISREICAAARAHRLPILYDVAGQVAHVELLAREYPDVNFILPHLGSFADDWTAQLACIDQISRHSNVYADTSGVRRFGTLLEAVRRGGPHKLLFGSDGPWLHPGVELYKVRALGLSSADEALVTGGNLLRLTGADVTNARARLYQGPREDDAWPRQRSHSHMTLRRPKARTDGSHLPQS